VKEDMSETFGDRLLRLRQARKISQGALARKAGTSQSYIATLETSKTSKPSMEIIGKLARALNVSIMELAGEEDGAIPKYLEAFVFWLISKNISEDDLATLTKIIDVHLSALQAKAIATPTNLESVDAFTSELPSIDASEKGQFYQQLDAIVEQLRNSVEANPSETMSIIDSLAALLKERTH
jgi:transcriptional regulator with XRE-family HTH domain